MENNEIEKERSTTSSSLTSAIFFAIAAVVNTVVVAFTFTTFIWTLEAQKEELTKDNPYPYLWVSVIIGVLLILTLILRKVLIDKNPNAAAFVTLFGLCFNAFAIVSSILLWVHSSNTAPNSASNSFVNHIENTSIHSFKDYETTKHTLDISLSSGFLKEEDYNKNLELLKKKLLQYKDDKEKSISVIETQYQKGILSDMEYTKRLDFANSELEKINTEFE